MRSGQPRHRAADNILDKVVDRLCEGIAAVNCILNPGIFILGGEMVKTGGLILGRLRERLAELRPRPVTGVTVSSLGDDGVALGAVQLALHFVDERHFGAPHTIRANL